MAKLKDAIIDGTYYQEKEYIKPGIRFIQEEDRIYKFFKRDIPAYFARIEREEKAQEEATEARKVPVKSKAQIQHERDWSYDEMVDNRLTLGV